MTSWVISARHKGHSNKNVILTRHVLKSSRGYRVTATSYCLKPIQEKDPIHRSPLLCNFRALLCDMIHLFHRKNIQGIVTFDLLTIILVAYSIMLHEYSVSTVHLAYKPLLFYSSYMQIHNFFFTLLS